MSHFRVILSFVLRALLLRPLPEQSRFAPGRFRRFACVLLTVVLMANPLLAASPLSQALFRNLVMTAGNWQESLLFRWYASGWAAKSARLVQDSNPFNPPAPKGWDGKGAPKRPVPKPDPQETQEQRNARIARIEVFPKNAKSRTGEPVIFNAIAYDADDNPIGGVNFDWNGLDEARGKSMNFEAPGRFVAEEEGQHEVTATAAGRQAKVKVKVEGKGKSKKNDEVPISTDIPVSSRHVPKTEKTGLLKPQRPTHGSGRLVTTGSGGQREKLNRRTGTANRGRSISFAPAGTMLAAAAPVMQSGGEDPYGWNSSNWWSADDPGNGRGNPPGEMRDDGAGSGNFQFSVPVLALDGRGLDLNLNLEYNSRVWHKPSTSSTQITFDIDHDWPAPGWSLGFGRIIGMGAQNGYMLVDADGTRHSYGGTLTIYQLYQVHKGYSTDGSFIDYEVTGLNAANGGAPETGYVWFPNGTGILYGAPGSNAIYPVQIVDANGNMINVSYRNNQGPQIETITDTLGRVVQFYYDSNNLLTAITAPGLADSQGSSTPRQVIRLHYHNHTLDAANNYGFSGLSPVVQSATVPVLDAIFYPGTTTGYWFNDSDSYSSYGMLNKVIEQRGMSFTDQGLSSQGIISQGSMSRQRVFNYPMTSASLTDVPKYTTMTDTWAAMYVPAAVTSYLIFQNSSPRRVEITRPDGTKLRQYAHNAPGQYHDGQVYQDEFLNAQGTVLTRTFVDWAQGDYQAPRPTRMEITSEPDGRNQKMGREFSYGPRFNQVTEVWEYDYGYSFGGANTLLRKTKNDYLNDPNYTDRSSFWPHIFNLVTATEIYAGDGATILSRAEYYYDEFKGQGANGLQACPNIVVHDSGHDPYVPGAYNPLTEYRGNVTTIRRFADPVGLNPATAEVETRRYDIAGNLVKMNSSCCEQTTFNCTLNTQYTWPESVTRGAVSSASHQNTTSATYDFNTGLVKTSTDANSRTSQVVYETASLRPIYEYAPTGAYDYHIYDDAGLIVYDLTYDVNQYGANVAARSDKYLDGFGRVHGEVAYGIGWVLDIVNTKYDQFGRDFEQSRPYRYGDTPVYYKREFDALGRVKKITAPDNTSITEYFFNEATYPSAASSSSAPGQTVRLKDQWGRERWARFDALNRMAEVVEPNPDPAQNPNQTVATGGWLTEYKYNARDELEEAWQWEPGKAWKQLRKFRYDGLGRMTNQKLAEREAQLDDNGNAGTTWSDYFSYDTRSRLIQRIDARRVRTNFSYYNSQLGTDDPLNRLQSVSYDKSQAINSSSIIDAPSVTYAYLTSGDKTRLQSVTMSNGVGNLTFGYDSEGRQNQRTQTFTGISTGYALTTSYVYDSLSRIWRITYPTQYFGSWLNRVVEHSYDIASRLSSLKYDTQTLATITDYNAASQTVAMNAGSLSEWAKVF